jgi:hypothetical protein
MEKVDKELAKMGWDHLKCDQYQSNVVSAPITSNKSSTV